MLKEGEIRSKELGYNDKEIEFICGNAEELPFENDSFDAYTISFGIRNVPRIDKAI